MHACVCMRVCCALYVRGSTQRRWLVARRAVASGVLDFVVVVVVVVMVVVVVDVVVVLPVSVVIGRV